jgi:hypothetical protein
VAVGLGLKFSGSGGVIMAGVAGEASLTVTFSYDIAAWLWTQWRMAVGCLKFSGILLMPF